MRLSSFLSLSFGALALASPASNHVIHEKRDAVPADWSRSVKLRSDAILPVRIALAQRNLDKGDDFLMEVSHPESDKFGKHWTAKEVAEMFAPSEETVNSVKDWLSDSGIPSDRIRLSQGLNWIHFDASVAEAEKLFKTEYYVYEHATGQPHVACEEYSLPSHLRKHIDFVSPTVHFDAKLRRRDENELQKRQKSAEGKNVVPGTAKSISKPGSGSLPKLGASIDIFGILEELSNCDKYITPDCLRALYLFPPNLFANPKNSYGIVEYSPQAYLQGDLDLFFRNFSKPLVGQSPILNSIDGGYAQTTNQSFEYNGESDLDLEYAMSLVYPQKVTLYQVGDPVESGSFNNFLDAIDGSYCTYEGGDDYTQDAAYPDPYPGGYKGPENCGGFSATKVISTSYGYNEADLTPFYEQRQCNEYLKLGLQGVTILYSSGDYGVAGNGGQCIDPTTGEYNDGSSGLFNPSFPGTCPYVTSVGATQVNPGASVFQPESAAEQVIYSGGGFSNVFPLPSYQAAAVGAYFANHNPPYGADRYNNSRTTRGYPDVSANGVNYVIAIDGGFNLVFGTSASSPTFGSIITLINEARLNVGKGPVGFLNPTLYAHPQVLNDITSGGNQGCGTPGFTAVSGWDPVTGLGTPNYPKLLALYLSLP
ncbi:hypothetical protein L228DRAFT_122834 [Xylona heveae TC161]|uniref:tripeptidyl-peptidase II n=1 Tax=Xylona heveae (strain CBS 132557 / TC161) TaxID=1328760 RepID=A0A165HM72_XYLHT|nr:hypothetical protein L228DRAFT_122834 [Xylona heveae TC161]KZF23723.1 hypothetical protein L228DRAFT_122834 [Xylona heveae TC161]